MLEHLENCSECGGLVPVVDARGRRKARHVGPEQRCLLGALGGAAHDLPLVVPEKNGSFRFPDSRERGEISRLCRNLHPL
jgi:hypothetical protein